MKRSLSGGFFRSKNFLFFCFLLFPASAWASPELDFGVLVEVLTLQNYNTRLVVLSTLLLGIASGLVGSFLLLRKRSLMGDTLSHATLPGICLIFLVLNYLGLDAKSLPLLLLGAGVTGAIGFVTVLLIRNLTRIKDDAAMGIVLSVFFGIGIALLRITQKVPGGQAAGLEGFIYGKTASMVWLDFMILVGVCLFAVVCSLLFFKELRLLCFDESYAASQGWPVHGLDILMLVLVTAVTVAGLQAVGLILVIAYLIIPASAARMWTHKFSHMLILAAGIGALSGWLGATISALLPNLPAGAIIVLVATAIFLFSLFMGPDRGLIARWLKHRGLKKRIGQQHLLRAVYEVIENDLGLDLSVSQHYKKKVSWQSLLAKRSWSLSELERYASNAYEHALLEKLSDSGIQLTDAGFSEAARVTRNHRLWEMYLIEYADVAPSHVDRDADMVEHILGAELTKELEARIARIPGVETIDVPMSPHPIK